MKAVLCREWGGPECLVVADVAGRELQRLEARVRVCAAGINYTDVLIIQKKYQLQPPLPFTPGVEAAGVVVAVGSGVTGLAPGARVGCLSVTGGFAEEVVLPANACFPLPDSVSFENAAVLPASYGTAWHALHDRGAAQAGETVLVLGAAGGVGLAAIQIAKALGAHVIAAASSREKLDVCLAHGADAGIDYRTEDLRASLSRHTSGRGPDLIVDPVGGALSEAAFRSVARGGRHLVIGFAAGRIPALPWNLLLLKNAAIVGVYWGDCVRHQTQRAQRQMATLHEAVAQGRLVPVITHRHTLEDVPRALTDMQARGAVGKGVVVLEPAPDADAVNASARAAH